jgi:radical SAM PhpK family P-methyltransferase
MKKTIDCFLIGHNEMRFAEYEKKLREMGVNSGAYRDLNLNFVTYNNISLSASDVYNVFCCRDTPRPGAVKPLSMGDTFSGAVAYLGTFLNKNGLTFDYVNSFQSGKEELAEKLRQENILTIAVITTLYVAVFPILEIVDFIRTYNRTAKLVIGGPFVSTQVRILKAEALDYLFDTIGADFYVNSSQGEAALVKLIQGLKENPGLSPGNVPNIYYRSGNRCVSTAVLKEDNRLVENMVNWDLFSHGAGEFLNIRASISCPFSCSFCGFPRHAGEYQAVPVEAIEKELEQIKKIGSVKSIHFIDDTFNVPVKRFKSILKMMIKNNYEFSWHSYFRCQFSDRETIELMKASGCEGVFLGIESGNDQILKNMNKSADIEKYMEGILLLKEYGIVTFGSFIVGFPGETLETVRDTVTFIEESGLDFYRTQLWYCEPITPIWTEKEKYDLRGGSFEWSHAAMDSRTACDCIDDIVLAVKNSIYVPQYNFDFDTLLHLVHRGMGPDRVKDFLNAFNRGIKDKLRTASSSPREVDYEVIKRIKKSCTGNSDGETHEIDWSEAEFDF